MDSFDNFRGQCPGFDDNQIAEARRRKNAPGLPAPGIASEQAPFTPLTTPLDQKPVNFENAFPAPMVSGLDRSSARTPDSTPQAGITFDDLVPGHPSYRDPAQEVQSRPTLN